MGNLSDADRGERGQALPLVMLVVLLAGLIAIGAGRLATEAALVQKAQIAADAAALAGAADGRSAANRAASANSAEVIAYEVSGSEVEVVVERRGVQAVARARRDRVGGEPWSGFRLEVSGVGSRTL